MHVLSLVGTVLRCSWLSIFAEELHLVYASVTEDAIGKRPFILPPIHRSKIVS